MSARTPVVLVTGIDSGAMAATTVGLQWDLPQAVVVEHRLDVAEQRLTRLVSDASGVVEHVYHDLEHACVSCALREDVVPTLERLASSGRWRAVVAHLPLAAEAFQVCRVLAHDPQAAPSVAIHAVLAAVPGPQVLEDLLGDDLLEERGLHTGLGDRRGVAETVSSLVEYADVVVAVDDLDDPGADLLAALARPGIALTDPTQVDTSAVLRGVHDHGRTEAWVDVVREGPIPAVHSDHVWVAELRSERPLHPERLLDHIEVLGGGPRRSRGCFWLPTRPADVGVWEGAGGQLSVGSGVPWGTRSPLTRIVVTGVESESRRRRRQLADTFERCLLTDSEVARRGMFWETDEDGLEPWLGAIRGAA
ncbi:MAG: GTP-binding protein [Nocardioides sp.]|nr:GTP-binding protein [Nocardioides sp.]